jgi:DNA-binding transcriptional LysR family regulator
MEHQHLTQLPYVIAMGKQCSLYAQGGCRGKAKTVSLDDYLSAEHLHVSSRRKGRGQVDVALHALGHKRQVKMRVQGYLMAEQLAQTTDLVWTVPEILAKKTPLKIAALPFEVEPLGWSLFWHKSAADDPANQWLRSVVSDIVNAVIS